MPITATPSTPILPPIRPVFSNFPFFSRQRRRRPDKGDPLQPVDRRAAWVMAALGVAIVLVMGLGDRTSARVREFSWQDRQISASDRAFTLSFNRPMDRASVKANLQIDPPLEGTIGWAGRRLAYTLNQPAPYGGDYRVSLAGSRAAQTGGPGSATKDDEPPSGKVMAPFVGHFKTRDLALAYIGTEGKEMGRLVLFNLTKKQKSLLTPETLLVNRFETWPDRRAIVFSATPTSAPAKGSRLLEQQLYSVPTGLAETPAANEDTPEAIAPAPELLLDNRQYQILKFALSPDGQTIAVQRAKRNSAGEFGLWLLRPGETPQALEVKQGGEFRFTPDGGAIALTQGQGVAILPVNAPTTGQAPARRYGQEIQPLDFLPKFGTLLDFAADGSRAALVKFNGDYTRSLFMVRSQGEETELARLNGSLLQAEFAPDHRTLYVLLTEAREGRRGYREQPYIAAIDLTTQKLTPLLILPEQPDLSLDLSPDGLALVFDRAIAADQLDPSLPRPEANDGSQIASSQLWLLPLDKTADGKAKPSQPQQLPFNGFRPRWLP